MLDTIGCSRATHKYSQNTVWTWFCLLEPIDSDVLLLSTIYWSHTGQHLCTLFFCSTLLLLLISLSLSFVFAFNRSKIQPRALKCVAYIQLIFHHLISRLTFTDRIHVTANLIRTIIKERESLDNLKKNQVWEKEGSRNVQKQNK